MIHREQRERVAILRLEHGKANACDVELARALEQALTQESKTDSRAVILTGTGHIFSAGVDLRRLLQGGVEYVREFLPAFDQALRLLFTFPKPVIAAVNGHAIAGGCIFACACDRRLMASGNGRIGAPELIVGVPFPGLAFECLRTTAPPNHLPRLLYSGVTLSPQEAVEIGLVEAAIEAEDLLEQAWQLASQLAQIPSRSFQLSKRQLRQPVIDHLAQHDDLENEIRQAWEQDSTLQAVADYVERTLGAQSR